MGVSGGIAITGGLTLTGSVGMLLRGAASSLSIRSGGANIGMSHLIAIYLIDMTRSYCRRKSLYIEFSSVRHRGTDCEFERHGSD